ncbi:VOC family protein [Bacillus alveayuensis]|uniref:VOC family protein n=1 Tax=Aeribacillus alveayuensis TaxID=279215 RepID=UPI0005D108E3|nr:VOC family protein [Bacillus alveayuensis]
MKLARVDHVAFSVKDVEKSKEFYGRILDLPEIPRPNFNFPGVWYKLGEVMIHIIQKNDADAHTNRANLSAQDAHLAFFVENVEELNSIIKKVESAEIPWYELENSPSGLRQVFFKDPDGYTIEIVTPNPESPYYESVYLKYFA